MSVAGLVYAKDGSVRLFAVEPELLEGIAAAARVMGRHDLPLVVTSINDAHHRLNSLHYLGRAFDCRSHDLPHFDRRKVLAELKEALNDVRWDVILEGEGTENEHFHCEIDPKE